MKSLELTDEMRYLAECYRCPCARLTNLEERAKEWANSHVSLYPDHAVHITDRENVS